MKTLSYELRFTTPAFLGNAEQNGQWRTPPFKALLRQWWRVAYSAEHGFQVDVAQMRRKEGELFGNAWLSHREGQREIPDHSKSLVRIRLSTWGDGSQKKKDWGQQELLPGSRVNHPEVGRIGPLLYLGYGPLVVEEVMTQGQRQYATVLKKNAAIQAGELATLSVAVPDEHSETVLRALGLMDRYGAVGGRSRNGWGSFFLTPLASTPALAGELAMRPWPDALKIDWPHAIGSDGKGALVWTTGPSGDWKQVMRELAVIKIGLRTQFRYLLREANGDRPIMKSGRQAGITHGRPQSRHWLSYPVTHHPVSPWGGNARLPNSLRLKVRPDPSDPTKLVGLIFHVPCRPPAEFPSEPGAIQRTWQAVHQLLDDLTNPPGSRGYTSIIDEERRRQLKEQLDRVTLVRSPQ